MAMTDEEMQDVQPDQDGEIGDSDTDDDAPKAQGPQTTADKRRAQNAIFRSHMLAKAESVSKEQAKEELKSADDEALSIRSLLAKQETNVITDPREYQVELFERAKEQNIIAVLDTGSGKTLIAVMLLRYILDQELEDRANGKPPRIAFFLVDSVTLVFQQFAVLECNLDHKVDRFCGAMRTDLWTKKTWDKQFAENMVIVCTAEVLFQCLMHSFINMDQINLLIFDEAHHAKKSHSYARIIKDFYLAQPDHSRRPRIFGMTASPVDAKVDVRQAARELENLLHCQIATTSDFAGLQKSISRPDEQVLQYPRLRTPFETPLYQRMKAKFEHVPTFKRLFEASKMASSHLGAWCSDMYWSFALADEEARKSEMRVERAFHAEKTTVPVARLDDEIAQLQEAAQIVREHSFGFPEPDLEHLSSKVLTLHKWLQAYFERPSAARCIVFVERRHAARLLQLIFDHIGGPHLHAGLLVGTNTRAGDLNVSFRQQVMTLIKFRKGELNCLFATSIAEEGLDIPDCNLVVRFDLYKTMIQYVQSRGRARHRNSKYLHMYEAGNSAQRQLVLDVKRVEDIMRNFCQALPEDRLLRGNDYDIDGIILKERSCRTYTEASTGAKLTYGSSLAVLAHFVSALPHDAETTALQPNYVMSVEAGKYICEVILPENSPVRSAIGRHASRKAVAKRSAAFEACIALRKGKYLDNNLLPIYTKQLPAMRNALLALNMKKTNMYVMRLKPSIWERTWNVVPTELFLTIIDLTEGMERPHQPLGLLTKTALPQLPQFPLYLNSGITTNVVSLPIKDSIKVTQNHLEQLTTFTLRVYKDIFNKTFEFDISRVSYWLAPVTLPDGASRMKQHVVDWDVVRTVHANEEYPWTPDMPADFLMDRFLVDKWDGGRRFFSIGVDPSLKPLDPVPENTAKGRFNKNILDYSVSLYKQARLRAVWNLDQPVVEAEKVLHRRNLLAEPDDKEKKLRTKCFLCPEPLRISALPAPVAAMCLIFPAIIYRIDAYLTALEACDVLGLDIGPELALEAMTKDSDNSEDHQEERINFRHGMGNNYERLEFLGDCFLKMATSISLFGQNPDNDEFEFHVKRMCLICNKNLFNTALKLKLYEYVRSMAFSRRTWYPEGLKLLEGKGFKKTGDEVFKHALGDKTIADICEAMIGAAFLQHDDREGGFKPENWDNAVRAVTKLVSSPDHDMQGWKDYLKAYSKPKYQTAEPTASQRDLAAKVELEHDYHFRWPRLLRSAFIHPSYPFIWERVPSYQRLEFLGDSLLDMACIRHLFYRFPSKDPQWLTEHKMAMVSNKFLGAVCVKIGFHRHLRYNNSQMEHQIREYVEEVQEAEREANGARDYWTSVKAPPKASPPPYTLRNATDHAKCLPDIVEAYIGAIFVDSDFNYNEVQRFFDKHIKWYFEDMSIYDTFANNHPTTHLHNLLSIEMGCRDYRLLAEEIPTIGSTQPKVMAGVMIHDKVVAEAVAQSGKYAKVRASVNALDLLQGLAAFEFRMRFGCDCKPAEGGEDARAGGGLEAVGSAI